MKKQAQTSANKVEVAAIYFPSWHPDNHYQSWYGKDFCEWELVRTARPLFDGHHQPKVPTWGYFDESDPRWAERQIDLAADHGVTTFLFDWYWYSGVRFLDAALEQGFLRAANRERLKFAVMWANHNWWNWPAVSGVPGMPGAAGGKTTIWLYNRHWLEDLDRMVDYCCQHYFSQSNYWLVDGKPHFVIYDVTGFAHQLGGVGPARAALERMDARAQSHGLPGLDFSTNITGNDNMYCCGWERVPQIAAMGFKSVFMYNIVRTPAYDTLPNDRPLVSYDDVIQSHCYCWDQIEKQGLPHHPVATMGCDVTPRWHRGVTLPMDFKALGYEPIIVGNTPEKFGRLCRLAYQQALNNKGTPRAMYINAWNEWTEGMYLLPEEQYGTAYLEALRQALT